MKLTVVIPVYNERATLRQLVERLMDRMRAPGAAPLMVATVAPSVDYEPYARTRAFYGSCYSFR